MRIAALKIPIMMLINTKFNIWFIGVEIMRRGRAELSLISKARRQKFGNIFTSWSQTVPLFAFVLYK